MTRTENAVPRSARMKKIKESLKDSVSVTHETVDKAVGKARESLEALSERVPTRAASKKPAKPAAPAPEPLERQDAPQKVHGDALTAGAPAAKKAAKRTPAKKTAAKKTVAKKAAPKKTAAKKTAAKKTPAKRTPAKKAAAKKSPAKKAAAKKSATKKSAG
jgi:hypothetical protein